MHRQIIMSRSARRDLLHTMLGLLGACLLNVCQADTLIDVYQLALKNDPKLQAAAATYRANIEPEKQALAQLLPQMTAQGAFTGSHSRRESREASVRDNAVVNTTIHTQRTTEDGTWDVSLTQPLFDLPRWFSFRSGQAQSEQAQAQLAFEQQNLIVRVAEAYFNVLKQWDNVQAAQAEELANKEQWTQAEERFKSGVVAITDVHEARAAFDASRAQRITDQGNLSATYESLTILTGQPHNDLWLLDKGFPISVPQPADRAEWVQFALTNNYALKAALASMEAARQNSTAKASEHLPKITGSLSYQDSDVNGYQFTQPDSPFVTPPDAEGRTRSAAVRLTMPLFSSGYTSSQARQANEQYNASLQKKIETERTVIQETRAKHIAANTNVERVQAREQAIESAQSALDAMQAGYKAGTRSIVDVLQTQRNLFASRRDHANARYDYIMDLLKLKELAGTLSPQDINDLNQWLIAPQPATLSAYRAQ